MKKIRISKKTLALAKIYADLTPETGYPDTNAAITFAKTILRLIKQ